MSEILQNTGAKLWSMVDDHDELQSNVFDQLFGTGGKSDIRLIDEAIGKINESLNGYYFKIINDKLCICKDTESGTTSIPLSITDDDGHVALKVDGTSITIDGNGVVHGATVDDAFSLTSENAIQNKVVKAKFDEVDQKISANETTISSHTTALETLNGEGEGSVKKTVSDGIAKVVADAPEDFDTLKEMSDWISSHESDATAMNSAIQKNKTDIATLQTDKVDKETGKSLLADTDKSNYDDAVSKAHTHDNKTVLDGITSDKVSAWDNKSEFSGSYNDLSDKPIIPKADGTTITADEDGTLHGATTVECDTELSDTSENPVQNKVIKAQIDALNQAIEDAKALKASLEQYGMVQLNDTSVVTDSTGLALPATEKNPNLEGTLANQISQLNTNLKTTCFNSNTIKDANTAISPGLNGVLAEDTVNGVGVIAYCLCIGLDPYSSIVQIAIGYDMRAEVNRNVWFRTRYARDENNWSDWYKVTLTT